MQHRLHSSICASLVSLFRSTAVDLEADVHIRDIGRCYSIHHTYLLTVHIVDSMHICDLSDESTHQLRRGLCWWNKQQHYGFIILLLVIISFIVIMSSKLNIVITTRICSCSKFNLFCIFVTFFGCLCGAAVSCHDRGIIYSSTASVGDITKKKKSSLRGQTAANTGEEFDILLNDPCGDQIGRFDL